MAGEKPGREQPPIFIGDELSALGYRLAGARVVLPDDAGLLAAFEQALEESPLVLVTAKLAARLPPRRLHEAMRSQLPLLLIVPDVQNQLEMPDTGLSVRRQLGMET